MQTSGILGRNADAHADVSPSGLQRLAVLAVVALAAAACGTTTPLRSQSQSLHSTSGAPAEVSSELGAGSDPSAESFAAGTPPTAGGDAAVSTTTRAEGTATTSIEAPRPGTSGRGFTATTITLGVEYLDASAGDTSALFGKELTIGDPKAQAAAVIDYLNDRGGLFGRRITPVFHGTSYTGLIYDRETTLAAACSDLTEDHTVFAATVYDSFTSLISCLAKRGVPAISMWNFVLDQANQDRYADYYYLVNGINLTRGNDVMVDRLKAAGWLTSTTRTGVLYQTHDPQYERAARHLADRITALGAPAPVLFGASSSASINNAIISFRQAGVDHVMFSDLGGGLVNTFMTAAESQSYRPLYGLNTNEQLMTQAQLSPAAQLQNVTGVSWNTYDVGAPHEVAASANKRLCLSIFAEAGVDVSDRTTQSSAVAYCDLLLFASAATRGGSDVSVKGLRSVIEALGSSYTSAINFSSRFGATRHDGPSATRIVTFDSGCTCFQYGPGGVVSTG